MRRGLVLLLAMAGLIGLAAALGFTFWRLSALKHAAAPPAPRPSPSAEAQAEAPAAARASTIIDLPGDPALVRRAAQNAPRAIALSVPAALTPQAPREAGEVSSSASR